MFRVTRIELAPIAGIHQGTGTQHERVWVVDPSSVGPLGPLRFASTDVSATTFLFQIDSAVVPNWFGVAVPSGITDFTNANLFFHPTPGQAGYVDGDYAMKAGTWPQLFYYMDRLGVQLDAARKDHVVIMPFLTEAAKDTGILPANWQSIVTQILTAVRSTVDAEDTSPLAVSSVMVSSFSAGIVYSDAFRHRAAGLTPLLREVWDFDGAFSSYHPLSAALQPTATVRPTKYDQGPATVTAAGGDFHVPQSRWASCPSPPANGDQVHGLVCSYMFLHAAWLSTLGVRQGLTDVPEGLPNA
jgi:hypothetical protein